MSHQLFAEKTSTISEANPDEQLSVYEGGAAKVAPSLRQWARELRAKSENLRSKSLEVRQHAAEAAKRHYDFTFPEVGDLVF